MGLEVSRDSYNGYRCGCLVGPNNVVDKKGSSGYFLFVIFPPLQKYRKSPGVLDHMASSSITRLANCHVVHSREDTMCTLYNGVVELHSMVPGVEERSLTPPQTSVSPLRVLCLA